MTDRTPTKVVNGAVRVAVLDEKGNIVRHEYIKLADDPTAEGTPLIKANLLDDTVAKNIRLDPAKDPTVNQAFDMIRENTYVSRDTAASMGYPGDITVDQALQTLSVGTNNFAFRVYLKTPGGRPLEGATITGFKDKEGKALTLTTDESGFALGLSNTQTVTITVTTPFTDIITTQFTITGSQIGTFKDFTLKMNRLSPASKTWSATTNGIRFSVDVKTINASVAGAGGGAGVSYAYGEGGYQWSDRDDDGDSYPTSWIESGYFGSAGAGGHTDNKANITYQGGTINIIVGAAGKGGTVVSELAGPGGASSIRMDNTLLVSAEGGAPGMGCTNKDYAYVQAKGNGNGAYTSKEGSRTYINPGEAATEKFLYPPTDVGGGGAIGATPYGIYYDTFGYRTVVKPGDPNGGEYGVRNPGPGGGGPARLGLATGYTSWRAGTRTGIAGGPGLAGLTWVFNPDV